MEKDYTAAIDKVLSAPTTTQVTKDYTKAIDAVIGQKDSQINANLYQASSISPDAAVKQFKINQQTKLPIDTVRRKQKDIEQQYEYSKLASSVNDLPPKLRETLRNPALAPVIKDDLEGLSWFERYSTTTFNQPTDEEKAEKERLQNLPLYERVALDYNQQALLGDTNVDVAQIEKKELWGQELSAVEKNRLAQAGSIKQTDYNIPFLLGVPAAARQAAPLMIDAMTSGTALGSAAVGAAIGAAKGAAVGGGTAAAIGAVTGPLDVPIAATGALVGAGRGALAGGAKGYSVGTTLAFMEQQAALSYPDYKTMTDFEGKPISPTVARGAAFANGVIGGALEKLSLGVLLKNFPGGEVLVGKLGKEGIQQALKNNVSQQAFERIGRIIESAGTEGATEFMQNVVQEIIGETAKMASGDEYQPFKEMNDPYEWIAGVFERSLEQGKMGVQAGIGLAGAGQVTSIAAGAAAKQYQQVKDRKAINTLVNETAMNKTFQRDPQAWEAATQNDLGQKQVHINADSLREFFQSGLKVENAAAEEQALSKDVTPKTLEEFLALIPDGQKQYDEAIQFGGNLILPANQVVSVLAQHEGLRSMEEFIKINPDALSDDQYTTDMLNRILPEINEFEKAQTVENLEGVTKAFETQLLNAGETPDSAKHMAALFNARYQKLAQTTENPDILNEIKNVFKLEIRNQDRQERLQAVNKIEDIDLQLDALRKPQGLLNKIKGKKINPRTQPLLSFLKSRGGVQIGSTLDGELRAMGITPKTNPGLFKKGKGITDVDNFEQSLIQQQLGESNFVPGEGEYADRDFILEQLGKEAFVETQGEDTRGLLEHALDEYGLDINTMSNEEIKQALKNIAGTNDLSGYFQDPKAYDSAGDVKTESEAFKKWFGDSKVVDENGKPLVVYHGTNQSFESFSRERLGQNTAAASSTEFFFTENSDEAAEYANMSARKQVSNAVEREANSERLLAEIAKAEKRGDWDRSEALYLELEESENEALTGEERGANIIPVYLSVQNPKIISFADGFDGYELSKEIKKAKEQGFDGLKLENVYDPVAERPELFSTTQWVVFEPTQIKSVNNRGSFDVNNPNILYQTPKQTPKQKFNVVQSFKTEEGNFKSYDVVKSANDVRRPSLFTVWENKDGWIVRNAIVPEDMQRKGLATDFYVQMNQKSLDKTGMPLRSTQPRTLLNGEVVHELSDDAIKLWDSFVEKGLAEKLAEKDYRFLTQPTFNQAPVAEIPETVKQATQDAIDLTGVTTNPLEAGFVTYDGKMLNLNGKREEGEEQRTTDHSAIAKQLGYEDTEKKDALYNFQKEAHVVRVDFHAGLVSANFAPTDRQINAIVKAAKEAGLESITVDYADLPNKVHSYAYVDNINARNIKRVFNEDLNGETLYQSPNIKILKNEGDLEGLVTGQPVKFNYTHNTASATKLFGKPTKDSEYGRGYEPSGRYVSVASESRTNNLPKGYVGGLLVFNNPLVVPNNNLQWKKELSEKYNGKTGKNLSKAIIKDGYDGVITTEDKYISEVVDLTTFDEAKALYQSSPEAPRGSFVFGGSQGSVINIFKGKDKSTVLHELMHFFLEVDKHLLNKFGVELSPESKQTFEGLAEWWTNKASDIQRIAAKADDTYRVSDTVVTDMMGRSLNFATVAEAEKYAADKTKELQEQVKALSAEDIKVMANNFLSNPKSPLEALFNREFHEYTARGFERYLREGKAPSKTLRQAFRNFKAWLLRIYKDIRQLNVQLDDNVRDTFDRMLASDEEIEAMRNELLFRPDKQIMDNLSATEKKDYIKRTENEIAKAKEKLLVKLLKDAEKKHAKWYVEERAKVRAEVEEQVNQFPVYRATHFLKTGKFLDKPTPEDVVPFKMNIKNVRENYQYGNEIADRLPRGLTARDGINPETVATMFDFENAEAMFKTMLNMQDRNKVIDQETDRLMIERHGDALTDGTLEREVLDAMHNTDRASKIAYEISVINRKTGFKGVNKEQFRLKAYGIIQEKQSSRINAGQYYTSEVHAAREAGKYLAKKDYVKAAEWKGKQLLNHYLYQEARIAEKTRDRTYKLFDRILEKDKKLSKSRNIDLVNGARALLAKYNYSRSGLNINMVMAQIQQYDPQTYERLMAAQALVEAPAKHYNKLTVSELAEIRSGVENMFNLSREQFITDATGKKRTVAETRDALVTRLKEVYADEDKQKVITATTEKEKTMHGILSVMAGLRVTESWTSEMDNNDIDGIFSTTTSRPIQDAVVAYRAELEKQMQQYADLFKVLQQNTPRKEFRKAIAAPELTNAKGIAFDFKDKWQLLHAILHTGNNSNKNKLVAGYGWGEKQPDGSVDMRKWDAFVARMENEGVLTKDDYIFAQGVWDLLEKGKPLAQKAHKAQFGYYFNEITAEPVVTKYGIFRGGYIPAIIDPIKTPDIGDKQDISEIMNSSAVAFTYPAPTKGFTISRNENYTRPLQLDIRVLGSHLDKVLRFAYLSEPVSNVAKLYMHGGLKNALDGINQGLVKHMIVPWLKRTAQQTVQERGNYALLDKVCTTLRQRAGQAIMTLNVSNALQQVTGISVASSVVSKGKLAAASASYGISPSSFLNSIYEKSEFLRLRANNQSFGLHSDINKLIMDHGTWENIKTFGERHSYVLQRFMQNAVDGIVWQAAFDDAIENGKEFKSAVAFADSTVRQTQGSFEAQDISTAMSGTPFTKLFTQFMPYFNMLYNLNVKETRRIMRDVGYAGAPELFYLYMATISLPAILSTAIVMTLADAWDDDESPWAKLLVNSQISTMANAVPLLGTFVTYGLNLTDDKAYNDKYSISPAIDMTMNSLKAVAQLTKENASAKPIITNGLNGLQIMTGMPVGFVGKPLGYIAAIEENKENPTGPIDVTRGLITGKGNND